MIKAGVGAVKKSCTGVPFPHTNKDLTSPWLQEGVKGAERRYLPWRA